jgi:hypothetical protein
MFCTSKENTKCSSLSAAKVINSPVWDANLRLHRLILRSRLTATIGRRQSEEAKIVLRSLITLLCNAVYTRFMTGSHRGAKLLTHSE